MKPNNSASHAGLIEHLRHFLPSQAPLKDFIHHNTLHAFQSENFHVALSKANKIFGYKTYLKIEDYQQLYKSGKINKEILLDVIRNHCPSLTFQELLKAQSLNSDSRIGKTRGRWKIDRKIDLDAMVHPLLFRVVSNYLDQGIAIKQFPYTELSFLDSIRQIERNGIVSFFKSKSVRELLLNEKIDLEHLLEIVVGNPEAFGNYLFDQQFAHPGYSGMVSVCEMNPEKLIETRNTSLEEFIVFELLLEIDALNTYFPKGWKPLFSIDDKIEPLFRSVNLDRFDWHLRIWQEAFEWTFYKEVLSSLNEKSSLHAEKKAAQGIFCIDDRECSIRRHLENLHPSFETFATAGFFNVEFYFQPAESNYHTKSCPAPLEPNYVIQELDSEQNISDNIHFSEHTNKLFLGWFLSQFVGFWSAIQMTIALFFPKANRMAVRANDYMNPQSKLSIEFTGKYTESGKQIGFKIQEMADRLEGLLKSIGLVDSFGDLIYVVGHGSSSSNNTHFSGYDCGACSGRPGSVNARVLCEIANREDVRELLITMGISIPKSTQFIPVLHDTCRDEFYYYDESHLSDENFKNHQDNKPIFNEALSLNAAERSRRFQLVDSSKSIQDVHDDMKLRSVSLFEPRPELNHATNALCIVGRRSLTHGVFLDRRAFLNSYDYTIDPEGKFLKEILNAVTPVCGGINLEYYFSRVDNQQLGAGTKLPHNVMGLFGVSNGIDGDLRTGLPSQMIEIHDPLRLMVIVEHFPSVIEEAIRSNSSTFEWFKNSWIHLVSINPLTHEKFQFSNDTWIKIEGVQERKIKADYYREVLSSSENESIFKIQSN
jgi:uncharacterized protein YbcC (UPF0753/DUF2309 family)